MAQGTMLESYSEGQIQWTLEVDGRKELGGGGDQMGNSSVGIAGKREGIGSRQEQAYPFSHTSFSILTLLTKPCI